MIRPPTRIFVAATLAVGLAACNQNQPERPFSADADSAVTAQFVAGQALSAPITSQNESPSFAILSLPADAGKSGKLTEKQFINGWRQSVSIDRAKVAGDWNDLSIDIQSNEPGDGATNQMRLAKPTQESVRREILARFQGVPMRIATKPMYNGLGPFGLAVGAGNGDMRCAYAWQWVANLPAVARGEKANFFNNGETPASIRWRICRRGVTADKLAEWYEGLQITDQENVARIVEALRRNTQNGVAGGVQVVDNSDSLEATLIGAGRGERVSSGEHHGYHRHAHHRRRAPMGDAPEPSAPMTTPTSPSADGRQYLGPVESVSPQYVAGALSGAHGAGFGPARVNPGLPAQAYRGPAGARAITPPSGGAPVYLGPKQ